MDISHAKTDENQPDFPPESLLKDKQEAKCQDQWLLAHGQQGVYSSYTQRNTLRLVYTRTCLTAANCRIKNTITKAHPTKAI